MDVIEQMSLPSVNGWDLQAYLTSDYDTAVTDYECYDEETVKAYYRDDWSFVGIVIVASRAGIRLGTASLWACEYGVLPDVEGWISPLHDDQLLRELTAEAIADAQVSLDQLVASAS